MGTSKGYELPKGGDWEPLKDEATRFASAGGAGSTRPVDLLQSFVRTLGGSGRVSRGRGVGQTRSSGGHPARHVGRALVGFLADVSSEGLNVALERAGLAHLIGKSATDVCAGLADAFSEPGSTLDEHAARLALVRLNDEILGAAVTYEEVEAALNQQLDTDGVALLLARFFANYLYELFCRGFYERWVKKVGSAEATRLLKAVKDAIDWNLRARLQPRDLSTINWSGPEGARMAEDVMRETLEIFEVVP